MDGWFVWSCMGSKEGGCHVLCWQTCAYVCAYACANKKPSLVLKLLRNQSKALQIHANVIQKQ